MAGQSATGYGAMLRDRTASVAVSNVELFFDLVYVFAVTQLSHELLANLSVAGALRTGLLLVMVWLVWAYTTWVTNWLDPEQLPVRLLLLGLVVASLAMSVALPAAFRGRGLAVGAAYAVMQVGRSVFAVRALRGTALERNFQRILAWCLASGSLALAGGLVGGGARLGLWAGAAGVDVLGGLAGFYTPGLGRSATSDWTIEGGHFAERCQGFILIALGESIVVIGATLAALHRISAAELAAFLVTVLTTVTLWWVYFDRSARDAAQVIAGSPDPGRLGRSAYHLIHPIMVAGIIVVAADDNRVLAVPGAVGRPDVAWLVLGGPALFLAGHAAFKWVVWRRVSWQRVTAVAVLGLLGAAGPYVSALALSTCAAATVAAVAASDRLQQRRSERSAARAPAGRSGASPPAGR